MLRFGFRVCLLCDVGVHFQMVDGATPQLRSKLLGVLREKDVPVVYDDFKSHITKMDIVRTDGKNSVTLPSTSSLPKGRAKGLFVPPTSHLQIDNTRSVVDEALKDVDDSFEPHAFGMHNRQITEENTGTIGLRWAEPNSKMRLMFHEPGKLPTYRGRGQGLSPMKTRPRSSKNGMTVLAESPQGVNGNRYHIRLSHSSSTPPCMRSFGAMPSTLSLQGEEKCIPSRTSLRPTLCPPIRPSSSKGDRRALISLYSPASTERPRTSSSRSRRCRSKSTRN